MLLLCPSDISFSLPSTCLFPSLFCFTYQIPLTKTNTICKIVINRGPWMKLINIIGPLKRLLYRLNQFDLNFKHFSSKIGRYYRQQYPLFWFETHQYIKFSKVSETSFFSFFQSKTELLKNPEQKAFRTKFKPIHNILEFILPIHGAN